MRTKKYFIWAINNSISDSKIMKQFMNAIFSVSNYVFIGRMAMYNMGKIIYDVFQLDQNESGR